MFVFVLASLAVTAVGVTSDDTQTVEVIVESVNNFLKDRDTTVLRLPNMGVLSTDPIKLRNGTLEGLDTMLVLEEPVINKKRNRDGSTTYMFFFSFGLKELSFHYYFESSAPVAGKGEVWLIPEENSLEAAGIVVIGENNLCDARLYSVIVEMLGTFAINASPEDLPGVGNLTQAILEFIEPRIIEVVDAAFEAETLDPGFQAWFSDYVCLYLKPKKLLNFFSPKIIRTNLDSD